MTRLQKRSTKCSSGHIVNICPTLSFCVLLTKYFCHFPSQEEIAIKKDLIGLMGETRRKKSLSPVEVPGSVTGRGIWVVLGLKLPTQFPLPTSLTGALIPRGLNL